MVKSTENIAVPYFNKNIVGFTIFFSQCSKGITTPTTLGIKISTIKARIITILVLIKITLVVMITPIQPRITFI